MHLVSWIYAFFHVINWNNNLSFSLFSIELGKLSISPKNVVFGLHAKKYITMYMKLIIIHRQSNRQKI